MEKNTTITCSLDKLVSVHPGDKATAIIGYSGEWEEYRVIFWDHVNDNWYLPATYYTSDLDDAIDTAKASVENWKTPK